MRPSALRIAGSSANLAAVVASASQAVVADLALSAGVVVSLGVVTA